MTSEHLDRDPDSTRYTKQEEAMTNYRGEIAMPDPSSRRHPLVINSPLLLSTSISDITDDDNCASMIEKKVQVSALKSGNVKYNQSKAVDLLALSKQWIISHDQTNNTVRKTTHHGIRTVMNPQMSQRYPTNERIMR